ncbi:MAG: glycosyltransferase family 2 protein, partial [Bacteroidota bacterium]
MAKVSIISVNYKEYEASRSFLNACLKQTHEELEVILIDNEFNREKFIQLYQEFPEVQIIADVKNNGFARGNNLGLQVAQGDYIFFLNNDTVPPPDLVEKMLNGFHEYEDAGGISPKILYMQDKSRIQYAGYTEINPYTGRNRTIGKEELDKGQYEDVRETAYLHGAACMVQKEVIEKVGSMPEMYFLYYEELDWSL